MLSKAKVSAAKAMAPNNNIEIKNMGKIINTPTYAKVITTKGHIISGKVLAEADKYIQLYPKGYTKNQIQNEILLSKLLLKLNRNGYKTNNKHD